MSTGRFRPGPLLGRRQAVLERELDQRGHVLHAQRHHQAAAIRLRYVWTDFGDRQIMRAISLLVLPSTTSCSTCRSRAHKLSTGLLDSTIAASCALTSPALALASGSSGLLTWSFYRASDCGAATRYLGRCGRKSDG